MGSRYDALARRVLKHERLVWIATAVMVMLSILVGLPPELDSNLVNMLPESNPSVAAIRRLQSEDVGINFLTLSFGSEDPEALDAWLDDLVVELEQREDILLAAHEVEPVRAKHIALLQFEADEIRELNVRLKGALALGSALNPMVTQRLMDMGPLTERIASSSELSFLRAETGRERVLVSPSKSPADAEFVVPFMEDIEATIEAADPAGHGIDVLWVGGAYRHTYEDIQGIEQDLVRTSVGSAVLVLGALLVSFRSWRALAIVFPPLLIANLINFALAWLLIGPLNTYTSLGTAILFGLGIDFAVHLVGRYRELRLSGQDTESAIAHAWARTGPPCTVAALTSAAGFLALSAAEFQGFAQLGQLLAVGLLVCLVSMLTLLPLLLRRLDHTPKVLLGTQLEHTVSTSTYRHTPLAMVLLLLATVAIGAWATPRVAFEYDLSALRRDGLAYDELTDLERDLARDAYSPVVVTFPDRASLVEAQARIQAAIAAEEVDHIAGVISAHNVLPSDQAARNEQLRELVTLSEHRALRYLPPTIAKQLLTLRGLDITPLTRDDLPGPVRDLLALDNPTEDRMLLLPKGNMWDVREAQVLSQEIERLLPGREAAGEYLGISAMFLIAFRDAPTVTLLALVLVTLLAWWDLKRPWLVVGAVITLLSGMTWAFAALTATNIKLTMVNLTGIPILLGIGIDVVIHLHHRIREEGPGGIRRALQTTGVAAGISAATTILSFLALVLAGHRGVRSLGELVVVGLCVVALTGLTMLPLGWAGVWRWRGQQPSPDGNT